MYNHKMKLQPEPFEKMASGLKTIELRLWDEKRQKVNIGDTIEFTNLENDCKISVRVIKLHCFASLVELYSALPLEKCGYTLEEAKTASYRDMETYYSPEEQKKHGVVGIEIELLEQES